MAHNALIGHTGFVGGALLRQMSFAATFNSRNIESIRGAHFDTVICAGVSAVKWLANKEPEKDWEGISRLLQCLADVHTERFVLISTIDVYREPIGLTELDAPSTQGLHAYGLHRLKIEEFVREHFAGSTIVRLPALFGVGLKKNIIYDMVHLNQTDKIAPNTSFQWYPTRRLANDLSRTISAGIDLINVTSEPVSTRDIHAQFFASVPIGADAANPPAYDLRSIHAAVLGGRNGYHLSRAEVMEELALFLRNETAVS